MYDSSSPEITRMLHELTGGDDIAKTRLLEAVYLELKRQARILMSRERSDHTLQPTALVNEAFLKLGDAASIDWVDRRHFYGIVSRLMRQILVDHARQHNAGKRGNSKIKLSADEIEIPTEDRLELVVTIDELLKKLAGLDETQARVIEMRFFAGMRNNEIAEALGISERTVGREWLAAKLWLLRELDTI
ncbi:MAG: sigma-70 family RNA polymerase sigma factor [Blastocatellia bacterium]|nr:sigma-70 family RNA polymerase sigma factor [Blastocatellia bacterium]